MQQIPLFHCSTPFQALFCYWLTSNIFSLTYGLGEYLLNILSFNWYVIFLKPQFEIEARNVFALMRCSSTLWTFMVSLESSWHCCSKKQTCVHFHAHCLRLRISPNSGHIGFLFLFSYFQVKNFLLGGMLLQYTSHIHIDWGRIEKV